MGKKAIIALREPSLGPCMGVKGGAAGGATLKCSMEDINLHLREIFHISTALLLSAMIDNHIPLKQVQIDLDKLFGKEL